MSDDEYADDEFVGVEDESKQEYQQVSYSTVVSYETNSSSATSQINNNNLMVQQSNNQQLQEQISPTTWTSHDLPAPPSLTDYSYDHFSASVVSPPSVNSDSTITSPPAQHLEDAGVRVNKHAGGLRSLSKQEKQTIRECKKSIKEDPNFVEPYVVLARLYNRVGDHVSTFRVLEDGLSRFPQESMFRHLIKVFNMQYEGDGKEETPAFDDTDDTSPRKKRSKPFSGVSARYMDEANGKEGATSSSGRTKQHAQQNAVSPRSSSLAPLDLQTIIQTGSLTDRPLKPTSSFYNASSAGASTARPAPPSSSNYGSSSSSYRKPNPIASSSSSSNSNTSYTSRSSLAGVRREAARAVGWANQDDSSPTKYGNGGAGQGKFSKPVQATPFRPQGGRGADLNSISPNANYKREQAKLRSMQANNGQSQGLAQGNIPFTPMRPAAGGLVPPVNLTSLGLVDERTPAKYLKHQIASTIVPISNHSGRRRSQRNRKNAAAAGEATDIPGAVLSTHFGDSSTSSYSTSSSFSSSNALLSPNSNRPSAIPAPVFSGASPRVWNGQTTTTTGNAAAPPKGSAASLVAAAAVAVAETLTQKQTPRPAPPSGIRPPNAGGNSNNGKHATPRPPAKVSKPQGGPLIAPLGDANTLSPPPATTNNKSKNNSPATSARNLGKSPAASAAAAAPVITATPSTDAETARINARKLQAKKRLGSKLPGRGGQSGEEDSNYEDSAEFDNNTSSSNLEVDEKTSTTSPAQPRKKLNVNPGSQNKSVGKKSGIPSPKGVVSPKGSAKTLAADFGNAAGKSTAAPRPAANAASSEIDSADSDSASDAAAISAASGGAAGAPTSPVDPLEKEKAARRTMLRASAARRADLLLKQAATERDRLLAETAARQAEAEARRAQAAAEEKRRREAEALTDEQKKQLAVVQAAHKKSEEDRIRAEMEAARAEAARLALEAEQKRAQEEIERLRKELDRRNAASHALDEARQQEEMDRLLAEAEKMERIEAELHNNVSSAAKSSKTAGEGDDNGEYDAAEAKFEHEKAAKAAAAEEAAKKSSHSGKDNNDDEYGDDDFSMDDMKGIDSMDINGPSDAEIAAAKVAKEEADRKAEADKAESERLAKEAAEEEARVQAQKEAESAAAAEAARVAAEEAERAAAEAQAQREEAVREAERQRVQLEREAEERAALAAKDAEAHAQALAQAEREEEERAAKEAAEQDALYEEEQAALAKAEAEQQAKEKADAEAEAEATAKAEAEQQAAAAETARLESEAAQSATHAAHDSTAAHHEQSDDQYDSQNKWASSMNASSSEYPDQQHHQQQLHDAYNTDASATAAAGTTGSEWNTSSTHQRYEQDGYWWNEETQQWVPIEGAAQTTGADAAAPAAAYGDSQQWSGDQHEYHQHADATHLQSGTDATDAAAGASTDASTDAAASSTSDSVNDLTSSSSSHESSSHVTHAAADAAEISGVRSLKRLHPSQAQEESEQRKASPSSSSRRSLNSHSSHLDQHESSDLLHPSSLAELLSTSGTYAAQGGAHSGFHSASHSTHAGSTSTGSSSSGSFGSDSSAAGSFGNDSSVTGFSALDSSAVSGPASQVSRPHLSASAANVVFLAGGPASGVSTQAQLMASSGQSVLQSASIDAPPMSVAHIDASKLLQPYMDIAKSLLQKGSHGHPASLTGSERFPENDGLTVEQQKELVQAILAASIAASNASAASADSVSTSVPSASVLAPSLPPSLLVSLLEKQMLNEWTQHASMHPAPPAKARSTGEDGHDDLFTGEDEVITVVDEYGVRRTVKANRGMTEAQVARALYNPSRPASASGYANKSAGQIASETSMPPLTFLVDGFPMTTGARNEWLKRSGQQPSNPADALFGDQDPFETSFDARHGSHAPHTGAHSHGAFGHDGHGGSHTDGSHADGALAGGAHAGDKQASDAYGHGANGGGQYGAQGADSHSSHARNSSASSTSLNGKSSARVSASPSQIVWIQCGDEALEQRMSERLDDERDIRRNLASYHDTHESALRGLEAQSPEIVHKFDGERSTEDIARQLQDVLQNIRIKYAESAVPEYYRAQHKDQKSIANDSFGTSAGANVNDAANGAQDSHAASTDSLHTDSSNTESTAEFGSFEASPDPEDELGLSAGAQASTDAADAVDTTERLPSAMRSSQLPPSAKIQALQEHQDELVRLREAYAAASSPMEKLSIAAQIFDVKSRIGLLEHRLENEKRQEQQLDELQTELRRARAHTAEMKKVHGANSGEALEAAEKEAKLQVKLDELFEQLSLAKQAVPTSDEGLSEAVHGVEPLNIVTPASKAASSPSSTGSSSTDSVVGIAGSIQAAFTAETFPCSHDSLQLSEAKKELRALQSLSLASQMDSAEFTLSPEQHKRIEELQNQIHVLQAFHDHSRLLGAPPSMRTLQLARLIARAEELNASEKAGSKSAEHKERWEEERNRLKNEIEKLQTELEEETAAHLEFKSAHSNLTRTKEAAIIAMNADATNELLKQRHQVSSPTTVRRTLLTQEANPSMLAAIQASEAQVLSKAEKLEVERKKQSSLVELEAEDTIVKAEDSEELKQKKFELKRLRESLWKHQQEPTLQFDGEDAAKVDASAGSSAGIDPLLASESWNKNPTVPYASPDEHHRRVQGLQSDIHQLQMEVERMQVREDHARRPASAMKSAALPPSAKQAELDANLKRIAEIEAELASLPPNDPQRLVLQNELEARQAHVAVLEQAIKHEQHQVQRLDDMQNALRHARSSSFEFGDGSPSPSSSDRIKDQIADLEAELNSLQESLSKDRTEEIPLVIPPLPESSVAKSSVPPPAAEEEETKAEVDEPEPQLEKQEEEEEDIDLVMEDGDTIDFEAQRAAAEKQKAAAAKKAADDAKAEADAKLAADQAAEKAAEKARKKKEEEAQAELDASKPAQQVVQQKILPAHVPAPPEMKPIVERVVSEADWMKNDAKTAKLVKQAKENEPGIFEEYACFRLEVIHLDRVGKLGATKPYVIINHQRAHIWEDVFRTETLFRDTQSLNPRFETTIIRMSALNHCQLNRVNRITVRHADSMGEDFTIGELSISFEDILLGWEEFKESHPEKYNAGIRKVYYLTRPAENKSFSKPNAENLKKFPHYPELKNLPKNCSGILLFHDVSVRLKTTPGVLLSNTTRLFPIEDGETDCLVRLNLHGKGLDKKDVIGLSDPFFQLWKLKPGGIIRKALPGHELPEDQGGNQDDLHQYDLVYQSDYLEHTLDPKFPTFVLPARFLTDCDYGTHLLLRMFDWDLGGDADYIGACHFTLKELMYANQESNRDTTITNKRALYNLKKSETDKKYKNSGVLTFRGVDVFTRFEDVDSIAEKSLARAKAEYVDNNAKIDRRSAFITFLMHGQLVQKAQAAMNASISLDGSGTASKRHSRRASHGMELLGSSGRDVFSSVMGPSSSSASKAGKRSSRRTKSSANVMLDEKSRAILEIAEEGDEEAVAQMEQSPSMSPTGSPPPSIADTLSPRKRTKHRRENSQDVKDSVQEDENNDEEGEEDAVTSLRASPRASPPAGAGRGSGQIDATMSMRNAADLFLLNRSRDAPMAIVFHCHELQKPGFFSSPDPYIEVLADRKLKGIWETVCETDVEKSTTSPTFPAVILKLKSFVSSHLTSGAEADDESSLAAEKDSVQIKVWHRADKAAENKLLGWVITSFAKLRTVHTRLELKNEKDKPAGVLSIDSVKVVSASVQEEKEKERKKKKRQTKK